ncbi:S8 family serine peptidase [Salininema proteolyticum]|uniref:S8 family serine peptidase n=1 Tax=Salininema proteolyticum TaxID=1607685 RepID=A0ABV8TVB9_9ACTN
MRQRRARKVLAAAGVGILVPLAVGESALAQEDQVGALLDSKVDASLLSEIEAEGDTELWLRFAGEADFDAARAAESKEAKAEASVQAAKEFAVDSQKEAVDVLESAGADFETYWASSTVKVQGDIELLEDLVVLDSVESVVEAPEISLIDPVEKTDADPSPQATEWGLDDIGAPDVWDMGYDGDGVTVAFVDTGADYTHPAITDQYRGNNGDGTFSHDYNYFDVQGSCGDEPCDTDTHGTHVTGTMVGDDGEGNQIGVAPGADWIGVNGCCPSLEALLESGEWIAAPTDWEGNNPDPSQAPDVVNNSWGTTAPGYDPFYVDIVDLWHAGGIIPVTSLGNSGPSCNTAGSPGIYPNVIGVGAYDSGQNIASFSARGPGVDGQIKPDISAPGAGVRSSVPGGGYASYSGTSMAAPHVAGQIALLLSAAPQLKGDYDSVYELLTGTARPKADDQCGSEGDANNVYGNGMVDAVAMINNAPIGDVGDLEASVVNADGEGLAGAEVTLSNGERERELTTEADGTVSAKLTAGDWDYSVSAFGYGAASGTITIEMDTVNEFTWTLESVESGTVAGTVVDGDGHGWPLGGTVSAADGQVVAEADPITGEFSMELPAGEWDLTVDPEYRGYQTTTATASTGTEDLVVEVSGESCAAPGYGFDPLGEQFESGAGGWEIVNNGDYAWTYDSGRVNSTPGSDGFAMADSDEAGVGATVDTELISPVFDLSSADDKTLTWANDYNHLSNSQADVLLSVDGGDSWESIWSASSDVRDSTESVDLSAWGDATEAQLKFHYVDGGSWAWWWAVDDVMIGDAECVQQEGGIVRGTVTSTDTGEPLAGAIVSGAGASTSTDEDGSYWMFVPDTGDVELTATMEDFGSSVTTVAIEDSSVSEVAMEIGTAHIKVSDERLATSVQQGGSWTFELELRNVGSAPGVVDFAASDGEFEMMGEVDAAAASWLSVEPARVTVEPDETVVVEVTVSGEGIDQPGTYTAMLGVDYVSPGESPGVEVSMLVVPRPQQGKLDGSVEAVTCDGTVVDLSGAQVQLRDPQGGTSHFVTGEDGSYERWLTAGTYTIIVSKDGYAADFDSVEVKAGRNNASAFSLAELGC